MTDRFVRVLRGDVPDVPPIWMMRQAGRYHAPYRRLRERHSFVTLCREPALAAEVAMGPVRDFDVDAAILFSDLLFPLEALGMALDYDQGGPRLDGPVTPARLARFRPTAEAAERLAFQRDAVAATRAVLPDGKGLIGFVGGPWTLFVYAVEGTHAGALARAKASPRLFTDVAAHLVPVLREAIRMQLQASADVVMVFDTAAGELSPGWFRRLITPDLIALAETFPGRLGYYARGLHPAHLADARFTRAPWAGVGYDARWDLPAQLLVNRERGDTAFVQGNFDQALLFLDGRDLEQALDEYLEPFRGLDPAARRAWICGLGHGVLPGTPEASVRTFVRVVRRTFQ